MRKSILFSAVLSLFLLVPASIIWAQTISSQKGLTTAVFSTQYGNVKVLLPDDVRAGDLISGTVIAEPNGNNARQVEKNLAELAKFNVNINGNKYTVAGQTSTFKWLVNRDRQVSAPVELMEANGKSAGKLNFSVNVFEGDSRFEGQTNLSSGCVIPSHALNGSPVRVNGSFDGDMSNTKCLLNNQPMQVLAESPRQCIVTFPKNAGGINNLSIEENEEDKCLGQILGVQMSIAAGKLDLRKGENTYIDVTITGLQNLPDTALLTLVNTSADVVVMHPSNNVVISLAPDNVSTGIFKKRFDIQSLKTGAFIVNVDLVLPDIPGGIENPPIQFDQKPLAEPRRLEEKALQIGLHWAIKKLIGDAAGARGQEWNTVCDNCRQCIEARMGTWAVDLVKELGVGIIKESFGKAVDIVGKAVKAVGAAKEFFDKLSEKMDNAEQLASDIEDKVRAGELQVLELKPQICAKNSYCLISGTLFYNPKTGCVFAIIYCLGTKLCCPEIETIVTLTYCTDEKGIPKDLPDISVIKK